MYLLDLLIGALTGILSGFGIGGGTLLMLWLCFVSGFPHTAAAGTNLVYFVCSAIPALIGHLKNQLVAKKEVFLAIAFGVPACLLGSFAASRIDGSWLHRGFGVLMLIIGTRELVAKTPKDTDSSNPAQK